MSYREFSYLTAAKPLLDKYRNSNRNLSIDYLLNTSTLPKLVYKGKESTIRASFFSHFGEPEKEKSRLLVHEFRIQKEGMLQIQLVRKQRQEVQ